MVRNVVAALFMASALQSAHAADVGVSVSIGQPGFYGQLDIGDFTPQPRVIYRQPVIIQRAPVAVVQEPIYLHVPPGHAKRWSRYCGRYDACGRPVYFVNDDWYNREYVPRYQEHYRNEHGGDRGSDRGYDRDDDHGPDRGPDHGPGGDRGHGNGHGNGHGKH